MWTAAWISGALGIPLVMWAVAYKTAKALIQEMLRSFQYELQRAADARYSEKEKLSARSAVLDTIRTDASEAMRKELTIQYADIHNRRLQLETLETPRYRDLASIISQLRKPKHP